MKIIYTKHAQIDKFSILRKHKFKISTRIIKEVIINPDYVDKESDFPKVIVSKNIDKNHVLRVVYRTEGDIILVVTFYPAEKGRYY